MATQHTPGPWKPHPVSRWVVPAHDTEMPICLLRHESNGVPCDEAEVRANAALIAAAPEMLEALQRCLQALEGDWERTAEVELARAALAKIGATS